MHRLFVGIELPEDVKRVCGKHVGALKREFGDLRVGWERPEKLHITIKFIGTVEEDLVSKIADAISLTSSQVGPFRADISAAGSFGSSKGPWVLWMGVSLGAEKTTLLASMLEDYLLPLGFSRETRKFSPHVTIARIKEPHRSLELAVRLSERDFVPLEFSVKELCLFNSELTQHGSRYTILSRHPLQTPIT
jgi:RNA 2',3'-cyclic 3'-phosphodiesterase